MKTPKSFYIETLGCKVNQYESQVIRENFLKNGYIEAENADGADICVVNTCTVTSTADLKSLKSIREGVRKSRCVVATGCLVEDKDLDLSRLGGVRFIVRNRDKYRIPHIIDRTTKDERRMTVSGITEFKAHTRAFVKIQDGCDNRCSYCKVRIVRGRSRSRPFKRVLDECAALIKNGSREVVLTGICLGAYSSNGLGLCSLIQEICKIDGEWRLRLSSIEPKYINKDLVYQLQIQKRLCKHLHIPFQSGDDEVLKTMDRPYKRNDYLNIVNILRDAIPDIAISTDIMVGFPGETEERFQNTMNFIKIARPMRVHIFPFSKRKGTKAYNYKNNINSAVKKQRKDRLLSLTRELSGEFANRFLNKEVEVLVETKRTRGGYLQGYTNKYIKLYIDGPGSLKGHLLKCRLTLTNDASYGILYPYSSYFPF